MVVEARLWSTPTHRQTFHQIGQRPSALSFSVQGHHLLDVRMINY